MTLLAAPKLTGLLQTRCPAGATLGEGLCWSPSRQALYWVDILSQRLYRYTPADDRREEWALAEPISALAERADAAGLLVTLRHGFAFFDPDGDGGRGVLERLDEPPGEVATNRFNDGKCDAQGRFWGGTMDAACVAATGAWYRFAGRGDCEQVLAPTFAVTNGPTWSLDGRTILLNDTVARRVLAFDFDPLHGSLSQQRLWLEFAAGDGHPDGMTTDAAGRIWIAHWGAACVTCHDPFSSTELLRLHLPTSHITNVGFGGEDLTTLFITSARSGLSPQQLAAEPLAGALFSVQTDAVGQAPNRFAG
jgi:sugar lactone lactonase YvrE